MKYKRYPKYKDSGVEWIKEIPEGWEVKRLKFLGKAIIGLTYDPSEIVDNQNGTLVLRASNIQDSSLSMKDCIYVEKNIPEKLRTKKDDILICSRNGSKRLIGKNIMLDEKLTNSTFGAFMTVFRSKYANFISKVLNSQIFKSQTGLYSTVTINQLTTSILNNIIIAFPKNELERKQISEFLETQTTQFDELIAKSKAQITLLEEKRQATINQAVTKGLDPSVPMKDSGIWWIGNIPEDWKVKKLKFVANFNNSTIDRHVYADEIPVSISHYPQVYHNEIISLKTKLSDGTCSQKEFENFRLKKDDVLITKDSEAADDIGVPVYILDDFSDAVCGYHIAQLSTNKKQLFGGFLFRFIQSSNVNAYFETEANGVTRYGLAKDSIGNLIIPLPPKLVQEQIYDFLQDKITQFDELIAKSKAQVTLLEEKKQALITATVTGKIDVRGTVA
jgi:type I restriction enzyme, S subunit